MIESFRHKGLKWFYAEDDASKLSADMVVRDILSASELDVAEADLQALNRPSFRLHPLKGELKNFWAVTVRANWRIVFRFENGRILDVDLVDYH